MSKRTKEKDKGSFEGDLKRLEEVIRTLDRGDLPLDEALALYEEGVALSRRCGKRLDEAEARIEKVLKRDGKLVKEDLDTYEE